AEGPNFQPSTLSHHALVASGSALASSVCVITPLRLGGAATFAVGRRAAGRLRAAFLATFFAAFLATFRGARLAALRLAAFFGVFLPALFFEDLRVAIGSSWSKWRDGRCGAQTTTAGRHPAAGAVPAKAVEL